LSKRQKQQKKTLVVTQRKGAVKLEVSQGRGRGVKKQTRGLEIVPAPKPATSPGDLHRGKRRRNDSTSTQEKLTSKQKRSLERENKRKKVGSNFYEVTNVKNRNRDRKVPKTQRPKPKY